MLTFAHLVFSKEILIFGASGFFLPLAVLLPTGDDFLAESARPILSIALDVCDTHLILYVHARVPLVVFRFCIVISAKVLYGMLESALDTFD